MKCLQKSLHVKYGTREKKTVIRGDLRLRSDLGHLLFDLYEAVNYKAHIIHHRILKIIPKNYPFTVICFSKSMLVQSHHAVQSHPS